jgi:hypothetical protein
MAKYSFGNHAALEYRWCRPPTRGSATTSPAFGRSTGRAIGASPRRVVAGFERL